MVVFQTTGCRLTRVSHRIQFPQLSTLRELRQGSRRQASPLA